MKPGKGNPRKGKPLLICFSGIDGSGKTTQARRLVQWLNDEGIKSQYVWTIFEPRFLSPLMKLGHIFFLRGRSMTKDYTSYYSARSNLFRYPGLAPFFHYSFFFEYLVRFAAKIRIPLWRGRTIICDRYIYDAVAGLASDLGYPSNKVKATIRGLFRFLPQPDLVFFLDLPEEIGYQRKDDVPAIDYLKRRRKMYHFLAQEYKFILLDGLQDIPKLEAAIRERVRLEMERGYLP